MNLPDLCPLCLDELPDGYPYDHVAIDLALEGSHRVYRAERAEAVRVGLTRGMTPTLISRRLHIATDELHRYTDLARASRAAGDDTRHDTAIRDMHARHINDGAIAITLGITRDQVRYARNRLGLPTLYGPGGRRLRQEVAA